ncbi:hypothetical protein SAMN05518672_102663 [Chitinophaga sp. CF118]|uniref:hypothetical protein n=1 Tax=Chitinophaga sp. CF118 TaxID=1884367 RepID=UPI0008F264DE|nr:hypothetical protein [Chitinophaga sp. CF118]SFD62341.1 hypothetical protein SAMN05518672_102663 [Chitinophaga sp. CF118]
MVRVYFNPDYTLASPMTNGEVKMENLQHIADVDASDLRTAFEICQNTDTPWTEQQEVNPEPAVAEGTRSIAPGDVLELDGEWYLVGANDFQKI